MTVKLGVVMDPIADITFAKDSTLAMLLDARRRGWSVDYIEPHELFWRDDRPSARMVELDVFADPERWFELGAARDAPLDELDVVLMRRDPPFDMEYVFATHLLELAEAKGVQVVNKPQALRDWNEKLALCAFPRCAPPTLISADPRRISAFAAEQREIVIKPLDAMGGASIFRLRHDDQNLPVVLELMTERGRRLVMTQRFIPEISAGDKRVLLVDGEPIPCALARIPPEGDFRGNLAVGAVGKGVPLSPRDVEICAEVGPFLREKGIVFAGLDIIGAHLTEINVTSPTGIRELDRIYALNIAGQLLDAIADRL